MTQTPPAPPLIAAPITSDGLPEILQANVASTKGGELLQLNLQLHQEVKQGDIVGAMFTNAQTTRPKRPMFDEACRAHETWS